MALWVKFSADEILKYFSYFSLKTGFDISCNCMKCPILFSGKNIIILSSVESAQRVVKVESPCKIIAEKIFIFILFFFFLKISLNISCESSAKQMIHIQCQDLSSLKKINTWSAVLVIGTLRVKEHCGSQKAYQPTVNNTNILTSQLLTLVLLNPDIPCLCKQCGYRSVGFCH